MPSRRRRFRIKELRKGNSLFEMFEVTREGYADADEIDLN